MLLFCVIFVSEGASTRDDLMHFCLRKNAELRKKVFRFSVTALNLAYENMIISARNTVLEMNARRKPHGQKPQGLFFLILLLTLYS